MTLQILKGVGLGRPPGLQAVLKKKELAKRTSNTEKDMPKDIATQMATTIVPAQ